MSLVRRRRREAPSGPQIRIGDGSVLRERAEPKLADPGLRDLARRDAKAIVVRAGKQSLEDQITDSAAALAYYGFMALPAVLLVALGFFALVASPGAVATMVEKLETVVPPEAAHLVGDSLTRVQENGGGGVAMIAVGFLIALWTSSGAMNALMRGLNTVYGREETRGFVKQRLVALAMLALVLVAFALTFGLLVLGPQLSGWIGEAVGFERAVSWLWWTAQWPILVGGLLLAFGAVLYLGPDLAERRLSLLTLGSLVAVVGWLVASGLFAVYVSMFGSYNKTWGSLSAVIVMLTWLWLSAVVLLFGAEVNAEARRSIRLRRRG